MATEGEGSSSSARRSELESSLSDQIAALHLQLEERDKEIEESYRVAFLNLLQGMCASSSSESGSQVDTARRGVPMAKMDADGLDFSDVLVNTVDAEGAWKRFCKSCESWSPPTTSGTLGETAHVHPIIERLLLAAASSATLSRLRVWRGKKSEDEIKVATIIPDFSVTPAGEGQVALINTVFFVEVKLPGNLADGVRQAAAYCRRAIRVLLNEAIERKERLDKISALAIATDGNSLILVKVWSGAPGPGDSWKNCIPCPSEHSHVINLLPSRCDFRSLPNFSPSELTEGFKLLTRLFNASDESLGLTVRLPLIRVMLQNRDTKEDKQLVLNSRLGCGGSSDVYSIEASQHVLKIARLATESVANCYAMEVKALQDFADTGCPYLPRLVFAGARVLSSSTIRPSGSSASNTTDWPAICITPKGVSLYDWINLQQPYASASASTSALILFRAKFADDMLSHLLLALRAAHSKGLAHCDLRPRNIVVVPGAAIGTDSIDDREPATAAAAAAAASAATYVLVDWGLARTFGEECAGRGVAAYAATATLNRGKCKARPALDLEAAVYTWLAVVYGNQFCDAPWIKPVYNSQEELEIRDEWLERNKDSDRFISRAAAAVEFLRNPKANCHDDLYTSGAVGFWGMFSTTATDGL